MAEVSFFFTNFPNDFQEKDLWRVFQRWGTVVDVFISRKLNSRKKRFGFVKFHEVKDEYVLKKQLDSIWIGTWKLQANRPKYRRQEKSTHNPRRQIFYRKVWNQKNQQGSYAQAVTGGKAGTDQKGEEVFVPHVRVNEQTSFWLESCFIGKMLRAADVQSIKESFILGGFNVVRVRILGGMYVLLSCEEEGQIKRLIAENKEWFEGFFESIVPWDDSFAVSEKIAWFRCRGLPLALWSNQCFERIGGLVGKLVKIDEGTISKEVLEYARLCIRIPLGEEVRLARSVRINDRVCQVYFEEENFHVPSCGNLFHKWGMASEDESEARLDSSISEVFSESDYSDHSGRQGERRREETTIQLPKKEEESSKDVKGINGGIDSVGKSQNSGLLEPRKEGISNLEKREAQNIFSVGIKSGTATVGNKVGGWADDLICSGPVQAQLSAESWVGETLIFDPIADVALPLGFGLGRMENKLGGSGSESCEDSHGCGGMARGVEREATSTAKLEKASDVSPLSRSKLGGAGTHLMTTGALAVTETWMGDGEGARTVPESHATAAYVDAGSRETATRWCDAGETNRVRSRKDGDTEGRGEAEVNDSCEMGGTGQIDWEE